jgi:hypothetical protein
MRLFNWGVAQGETLQEVGDAIANNMTEDSDDMEEYEKSLAIAELRARMLQSGAAWSEVRTVTQHVRGRLG